MFLCNNRNMNSHSKIRFYMAIEVIVWILIIVLTIGSIKYYNVKKHKELKTYQLFMQDVDGLIEGSSVRLMGVPIGYVKTIRIVHDNVYVRFVLTNKGVLLPKGVIATVEFNGMAGSKSLELYPPTEQSKAEGNLIAIKQTNRLGAALGLLDDMFGKLASIMSRCDVFSQSLSEILPQTQVKSDAIIQETVEDLEMNVNWFEKLVSEIDKRRLEIKTMLKPKPKKVPVSENIDEESLGGDYE